MRGEVLFEKMTGISEAYITEAALVPAAGVAPTKKKPFASLSRVLNSGWGVACICFIVAIAAVIGMVAWGRMGDMTDPGSDPDVRFAFSYEMTNNDGSAWSGTAYPGDLVNVDTTVVNQGKAFDTYDFFAYAKFVLPEDESVVIEGHYPLVDTDRHTVENGGTGSRAFHFHIPENATPGVYDLVLSFDGVQQVYSGALTVGEPTNDPIVDPPLETDYPLLEDGHPFSFGYEPFGGFAIPGDSITIQAWVVNEGEPFSYIGDPFAFQPIARLYHMESGYLIDGLPSPTGVEPHPCNVLTGQKGTDSYQFRIPTDAPTGEYGLKLSYKGQEQTFEGLLTLAVPTVIDPAVLYNLTMPVGSDWLYEPIEEAYVDGETVTVRIKFATDVGTLFFLNGELLSPSAGDDRTGYWEYSFYMPKKDSKIIFKTYDGTAPYSDILEAYHIANPEAEDVRISDYGTYGDGVRVAIIEDARFLYTAMEEEHRIGPAVIRYSSGNFMQALIGGEFHTLQKAYESGSLSDADMAALENLQRERNPYLYADNE